jgi:L-lactate dehydrogenase (cytochrome)
MLRADDLAFPNWLSEPREVDAFLAGSGPAFDAALTWAQIEKVRDLWSGRLVLKGPLSPQDAARARASGVDGVHLSNHGGRQLDRCVPTLEILPAVRDAVGEDYPIIIDSGIRSGGDIAVALALGADFVAVGRSYLYPLAVAGEEGVVLAIEQLTAQLRQTVALVGLSSVSELRAHGRNVLLRSRWTTCVLGGRGLNHRDIPPEDTR